MIVKAEAVLESLFQNDYIYDTAFAVVVRDDVNGVNLFTGIVRNPAQ